MIAQQYGDSSFKNAQLIAAAPDLLESLEKILPRFMAKVEGAPVQDKEIVQALKAIKKAKGE